MTIHYVRPVDEAEPLPTGHPGLTAKLLSHQESAMVFSATVRDGGRAAGLHYHDRDQVYFQLCGTMTARLGDDVHRIEPHTLVYIPAGLPHCNWNEGPGDESHLEMIVPATQLGAPLAHMLEAPGQVPPDSAPHGSAVIVTATGAHLVESTSDDRRHSLIGSSTTSSLNIDFVEVPSQTGWHDTCIHQVDKHYFVLAGQLDFEIALTSHSAGPNTLVSLPAGVPHRIFNTGREDEMHLELTTAVGASEVLTDQPVRVFLSHSE